MKKDKNHIKIREKVGVLLNRGFSIDEIATQLNLEIGSRFIKSSAKWYRYCVRAKSNQRKAVEKDPNLYSKAGKIAQQKHPWIGHVLGKKYGPIQAKILNEKTRGDKQYFSNMARKLQELNPEHSRNNMKKAHETMKKNGTFNIHQKEAAFKCMKKRPNHMKEMSKIAHERYPLGLLALETRRKKYLREFMGCLFDSIEEMKLCKKFVETGLMDKPLEGKNLHFKLKKHHVDFFINEAVFVEYHPPQEYGRKKGETKESYYHHKRSILNNNRYNHIPLIVITDLKGVDSKIEKIKDLVSLKRGL